MYMLQQNIFGTSGRAIVGHSYWGVQIHPS